MAYNTSEGKSLDTYLEFNGKKIYFSVISRESIETQTTTTDHYLESGAVIQDHAVDLPLRYTLSGFVAEKVHKYEGEPKSSDYVDRAMMQDTLRRFQTLAQVAPKFSSYVYSAINTGRFIAGKVTGLIKAGQGFFGTDIVTKTIRNKFENLPASVTGLYGYTEDELKDINKDKSIVGADRIKRIATEQSSIRWQLEQARLAHEPIILHHPWGANDNVIIENINFTQTNSWSVSDFTVTLKQIRYIEASVKKKVENKNEPASQRAKKIKNGNVKVNASSELERIKMPDGTTKWRNTRGLEMWSKKGLEIYDNSPSIRDNSPSIHAR